MSYAVMSINKVKSLAYMNGLQSHNERAGSLKSFPHIDPSKSFFNQEIIKRGESYSDAFNDVIDKAEAKFRKRPMIKKNSVLALDFLLTFSHQAKEGMDYRKWIEENRKWLAKNFGGEDNIIAMTFHADEETPHIHALVVPITKDGGLSAFKFINGRYGLKRLQTDYAKTMKKFGLERGQINSKAKRQDIKKFYSALDEISNNPYPVRDDMENDDDYIERLQNYVTTQKRALLAKDILHKRELTEVDTGVTNIFKEYSNALWLFNRIADNVEDKYAVRRRLLDYQYLELCVPPDDLEKIIEDIKEKYPLEKSVMGQIIFNNITPTANTNEKKEVNTFEDIEI